MIPDLEQMRKDIDILKIENRELAKSFWKLYRKFMDLDYELYRLKHDYYN